MRVCVCIMPNKLNRPHLRYLLSKLSEKHEIVKLDADTILYESIDRWPVCDVLLSFYHRNLPFYKVHQYCHKYGLFAINDFIMQYALLDRRIVDAVLRACEIPVPKGFCINRGSFLNDEILQMLRVRFNVKFNHSPTKESDIIETDKFIELKGQRLYRPFIEKPANSEDHDILIYHPTYIRRLFRKKGNRSSCVEDNSRIRRTGSYTYAEYLYPDNGNDIKVYALGAAYAHAESRKAPTIDGMVQRDDRGKELRVLVRLRENECEYARRITAAFRQRVCGFDILRAFGRSYVIDVNGWSFVKTNCEYYNKCADMINAEISKRFSRELSPDAQAPEIIRQNFQDKRRGLHLTNMSDQQQITGNKTDQSIESELVSVTDSFFERSLIENPDDNGVDDLPKSTRETSDAHRNPEYLAAKKIDSIVLEPPQSNTHPVTDSNHTGTHIKPSDTCTKKFSVAFECRKFTLSSFEPDTKLKLNVSGESCMDNHKKQTFSLISKPDPISNEYECLGEQIPTLASSKTFNSENKQSGHFESNNDGYVPTNLSDSAHIVEIEPEISEPSGYAPTEFSPSDPASVRRISERVFFGPTPENPTVASGISSHTGPQSCRAPSINNKAVNPPEIVKIIRIYRHADRTPKQKIKARCKRLASIEKEIVIRDNFESTLALLLVSLNDAKDSVELNQVTGSSSVAAADSDLCGNLENKSTRQIYDERRSGDENSTNDRPFNESYTDNCNSTMTRSISNVDKLESECSADLSSSVMETNLKQIRREDTFPHLCDSEDPIKHKWESSRPKNRISKITENPETRTNMLDCTGFGHKMVDCDEVFRSISDSSKMIDKQTRLTSYEQYSIQPQNCTPIGGEDLKAHPSNANSTTNKLHVSQGCEPMGQTNSVNSYNAANSIRPVREICHNQDCELTGQLNLTNNYSPDCITDRMNKPGDLHILSHRKPMGQTNSVNSYNAANSIRPVREICHNQDCELTGQLNLANNYSSDCITDIIHKPGDIHILSHRKPMGQTNSVNSYNAANPIRPVREICHNQDCELSGQLNLANNYSPDCITDIINKPGDLHILSQSANYCQKMYRNIANSTSRNNGSINKSPHSAQFTDDIHDIFETLEARRQDKDMKLQIKFASENTEIILKWGGTLTHTGVWQSRELGEILRYAYIEKYPKLFNNVRITASIESRVHQTARIFAEGLLFSKDTSIMIDTKLLGDTFHANEMIRSAKKDLKEMFDQYKTEEDENLFLNTLENLDFEDYGEDSSDFMGMMDALNQLCSRFDDNENCFVSANKPRRNGQCARLDHIYDCFDSVDAEPGQDSKVEIKYRSSTEKMYQQTRKEEPLVTPIINMDQNSIDNRGVSFDLIKRIQNMCLDGHLVEQMSEKNLKNTFNIPRITEDGNITEDNREGVFNSVETSEKRNITEDNREGVFNSVEISEKRNITEDNREEVSNIVNISEKGNSNRFKNNDVETISTDYLPEGCLEPDIIDCRDSRVEDHLETFNIKNRDYIHLKQKTSKKGTELQKTKKHAFSTSVTVAKGINRSRKVDSTFTPLHKKCDIRKDPASTVVRGTSKISARTIVTDQDELMNSEFPSERFSGHHLISESENLSEHSSNAEFPSEKFSGHQLISESENLSEHSSNAEFRSKRHYLQPAKFTIVRSASSSIQVGGPNSSSDFSRNQARYKIMTIPRLFREDEPSKLSYPIEVYCPEYKFANERTNRKTIGFKKHGPNMCLNPAEISSQKYPRHYLVIFRKMDLICFKYQRIYHKHRFYLFNKNFRFKVQNNTQSIDFHKSRNSRIAIMQLDSKCSETPRTITHIVRRNTLCICEKLHYFVRSTRHDMIPVTRYGDRKVDSSSIYTSEIGSRNHLPTCMLHKSFSDILYCTFLSRKYPFTGFDNGLVENSPFVHYTNQNPRKNDHLSNGCSMFNSVNRNHGEIEFYAPDLGYDRCNRHWYVSGYKDLFFTPKRRSLPVHTTYCRRNGIIPFYQPYSRYFKIINEQSVTHQNSKEFIRSFFINRLGIDKYTKSYCSFSCLATFGSVNNTAFLKISKNGKKDRNSMLNFGPVAETRRNSFCDEPCILPETINLNRTRMVAIPSVSKESSANILESSNCNVEDSEQKLGLIELKSGEFNTCDKIFDRKSIGENSRTESFTTIESGKSTNRSERLEILPDSQDPDSKLESGCENHKTDNLLPNEPGKINNLSERLEILPDLQDPDSKLEYVGENHKTENLSAFESGKTTNRSKRLEILPDSQDQDSKLESVGENDKTENLSAFESGKTTNQSSSPDSSLSCDDLSRKSKTAKKRKELQNMHSRYSHIINKIRKNREMSHNHVSEIYNNLKYDIAHNNETIRRVFTRHDRFFYLLKRLNKFIIQNEYGKNPEDRIRISRAMSQKLFNNLIHDIENTDITMHVYFTKESKIYTLFNLFCNLISDRSIDIQEFDYGSYISLEIYSNGTLRVVFNRGSNFEANLFGSIDSRHRIPPRDDELLFEMPLHLFFEKVNQAQYAEVNLA